MKSICLIIGLSALVLSCEPQNTIQLRVESVESPIDSLYLYEAITEKLVAQIPLGQAGQVYTFPLDYTSTGILQSKNGEKTYLSILTPGKTVEAKVAEDTTIITNSLADSLLNYLWKSSNNFIADHGIFLFNTNDTDSILHLFEGFREKRKEEIEQWAAVLSKPEKAILHYQNEARIYSFLFYFGRLVKKFPPEHPFFAFLPQIDNNLLWTKSLPQNILYKYELEYLLEQDSLESVNAFTNFIEERTKSSDLSQFFKAIYLKEIMENPSYWAKHEKLFDATVLERELEKEKDNIYFDLIKRSSSSYFSSQKGEVAYDFEAEKMDGSKFKLSDLKGKLVFIDNWASWCGPCLVHRPKVLQLAEKYKNNPNISFLMISVDASRARWKNYLKENQAINQTGLDLIIENGMNTEYGDQYNIRFIPKYVLIDESGKIINADLREPGLGLERLIAGALKSFETDQ